MRKCAVAAAAAFAAMVTTLSGTPAEAGQQPLIQVDGQGTYVLNTVGAAVLSGAVSGMPIGGNLAGRLAAADGSLPDPGECEPGNASLRVDQGRRDHLALRGRGTVCGEFLQDPFVVTHVFTGRYGVRSSSRARLVGTDGFFEVRLATEGRASFFAIDT